MIDYQSGREIAGLSSYSLLPADFLCGESAGFFIRSLKLTRSYNLVNLFFSLSMRSSEGPASVYAF